MIDLHCHIIWGVDDGPQTREETLDLARAAARAGTTTIVATSHVAHDYPANGSEVLGEGLDAVRAALAEAGIDVEVLPGAEVALTRALDLPDAELWRLTLNRAGWLLLECPFTGTAAGFERPVAALAARGHRILLAHPERIAGFRREPDRLRALVDRGALCSVTAGSLAGRFGGDVRRFTEALLAAGLVHNVASDAHGTGGRPPGVADELASAGVTEEWIAYLTLEVPRAILAGAAAAPAPPEGPAIPPRGPLARWRLRRAS